MSAPNTSTKFAQVLQKELQDIRTRRGEKPMVLTWDHIFRQVSERILKSEMPALLVMVQAAKDEPKTREAFVAQFIDAVDKEAFPRGFIDLTAEQQPLRQVWDKAVRSILQESLTKELRRISEEIRKEPPAGDSECASLVTATIGGVLWEIAAQATRHDALGMGLVGLAFSGGGIRSATFNLGVTQVLAELGLLPTVDYLSTVSGGGYIGSWLTAWMKRAGSVESVAEQLKPSRMAQAKGRDQPPVLPADQEPEPINHLRAYSNYLSPRSGLSSADTWVLIAIYLRNVLLNQFVLLPFIMGILLVPRFLVWFYQYFGNEKLASAASWHMIILVLLVSSLGISLFFIGLSVHHMRVNRRQGEVNLFKIQNAIRILVTGVIVPLFIFALLITWLLSWDFSIDRDALVLDAEAMGHTEWQAKLEKLLPFDFNQIRGWDTHKDPDNEAVMIHEPGRWHHIAWILLLGTLFGGITGGVHLVLGILNVLGCMISFFSGGRRSSGESVSVWKPIASFLWSLMAVTVAGFATSTLYYAVFGILFQSVYFVLDCDVAVMASFGPPLVIGIIVLGFNFAVGLRGSGLTEDVRELWASLCGWLILYAVVWAAVVSAALFGPALLQYLGRELGAWSQAVLGATWLGTAIGGALAGQSDKTANGKGSKRMESFTRAVPPFFVLGLLLLTSLILSAIIENWPDQADLNVYFRAMNIMPFLPIFWWWVGCVAVALFMAYCVDVNIFSLHGLYANRLIRCYLGASRAKGDPLKISDRRGGAPVPGESSVRSPNPITGFDPNDDMPLSHLRIGSVQDNPDVNELMEAKKYAGPFYLINTALNLMTGDELAWQERKAESFVLSPLFCGSQSTGFRRLPESDDNALSLGNAVTLSGAAVSPNMGYHSSPAVAALLTIFNFRLGGWMANPRHFALSGTGPSLGLLYLCKELYGRANARSSFVYLSDGGHFENLGVYELVRRRCRYIISSDVGADGDLTFEDLGGLIRKVRTDFGIRIDVDVAPIRKLADTGFSRWHCAIGKIRYNDVDPNADDGVIVYLKSSMTGDEPSDVLQFHSQHPEFPHTPTSDQFFNESKFESYRALGYHVAKTVLCEAVADIKDRDTKSPSEVSALLFNNLHDRWFPPPSGTQHDFLKSTKGYIDLHHSLRTDTRLHDLTREIYGSLDAQLHDADDKPIVQLHIISQMLQLMEDVWVGLQLDANRNYPLYQGWLESFGRWAKSPIFRRHWPTLRAEYSKDFQRFCQSLIDGKALPKLDE